MRLLMSRIDIQVTDYYFSGLSHTETGWLFWMSRLHPVTVFLPDTVHLPVLWSSSSCPWLLHLHSSSPHMILFQSHYTSSPSQSCLLYFPRCLRYSECSLDVLISNSVFSSHAAPPAQCPHLCYIDPLLIGFPHRYSRHYYIIGGPVSRIKSLS